MEVTSSQPLPQAVQHLIAEPEIVLQQGLLAEIHRAWAVRDNRLVVWGLHDTTDVSVHEEEQVIRSLALVMPRPGVFSRDVRYLLVLATPVLVRILAVSFEPVEGSSGPFAGRLVLTPTMSTGTDGNRINAIAGTAHGRVFLAGDSGVLQELVYDSERSHAGSLSGAMGLRKRLRTCEHPVGALASVMYAVVGDLLGTPERLVALAVDHYRGMLWAADAVGGITLWSLGREGDTLSHVDSLRDPNAACLARLQAGSGWLGSGSGRVLVGRSTPFTGLHVIPPCVSNRTHLVAVTASGGRAFFTSCASGLAEARASKGLSRDGRARVASGIVVLRFAPPPASMSASSEQGGGASSDAPSVFVGESDFADGVTLLAGAMGDGGSDTLVATSVCPESLRARSGHRSLLGGSSQGVLEETRTLSAVQGKVYAIQAQPTLSVVEGGHFSRAGALAVEGGDAVALPPSSTALVAAQGLAGTAADLTSSLSTPLEAIGGLMASVLGGTKRPRPVAPTTSFGQEMSARLGPGTASTLSALPHGTQLAYLAALRRLGAGNMLVKDHIVRMVQVLSTYANQVHPGRVRRWYVLTHAGVHTVTHFRPVDQVAALLLAVREDLTASSHTKTLLDRHGEVELCAAVAAAAASGSEAVLPHPSRSVHAISRDEQLSAALAQYAVGALQRLGGTAALAGGAGAGLKYSNKLRGIHLHIRRLLGAVWTAPILTVTNKHLLTGSGAAGSGGELSPEQRKTVEASARWSEAEVQAIINGLESARALLGRIFGERVLTTPTQHLVADAQYHAAAQGVWGGTDAAARTQALNAAESAAASMTAVFLERAQQALHLVCVLAHPAARVGVAFRSLPKDTAARASTLTLEEVTTSTDRSLVVRLLHNVTAALQEAPRAGTAGSPDSVLHSLAETLGNKCPDFFAPEDSALWNALRELDAAARHSAGNIDGRARLVASAVQRTLDAVSGGRLSRCIATVLPVFERLVRLGECGKVVTIVLRMVQVAEADVFRHEHEEQQALLSLLERGVEGEGHPVGTRAFSARKLLEAYDADTAAGTVRSAALERSWAAGLVCGAMLHAWQTALSLASDAAANGALVQKVIAFARTRSAGPEPTSAAPTHRQLLAFLACTTLDVVRTSHPPLHFALYWWLNTTSPANATLATASDALSTLLLLDSAIVPVFLRDGAKDLPRLHLYYKVQGLPVLAARVQHALYENTRDTEVALAHLQQAVQELEAVQADALSAQTDISGVVARWRGELAEATLQSGILASLTARLQRGDGSGAAAPLAEAVTRLQHNRLRPDVLMAVCEELGEVGHQLRVLHVIGAPQNAPLVSMLWEQLVASTERECQAAEAGGGATAGSRPHWRSVEAQLIGRAGQLGRELYTPPEQLPAGAFTAFPVSTVVRVLEEHAVVAGWVRSPDYDCGWVALQVLGEAGVPWLERYHAYADLLDQRSAADATTLTLIRATLTLVKAWVEAASAPHSGAATGEHGAQVRHTLYGAANGILGALQGWSRRVAAACDAVVDVQANAEEEEAAVKRTRAALREFLQRWGGMGGAGGGSLL